MDERLAITQPAIDATRQTQIRGQRFADQTPIGLDLSQMARVGARHHDRPERTQRGP